MDALDFITEDVARRPSPLVRWAFIAGAAILPVAIGVGMRDSWDGVGEPRVLIPNVVAALLLGVAAWLSMRRTSHAFAWVRLALIFAAFLAIERAAFPPGGVRTTYPDQAELWHQSARCFIKGSITTALLGAWLGGFAFAFSSWPSRRWRAVLAFASGVAGAVMLGFHCDSSSWAHIIFGHLAQGLVVGAAIFGVLELAFHRGLRARLPWLRSARRLG